jgi:glycosyltransferase involved in cell wall biosynthesis
MHVLVFEPDHSGHHFPYLRIMLPAVARLASRVSLVTGRDAVDSVEFKAHLAPAIDGIHVHAVAQPPKGNPLDVAKAKLADLRASMQSLKPDHLLIPYADGITQLISLRWYLGNRILPRGVESEALHLRGGFAYPVRGWVDHTRKRLSLASLAHAPWTVVHHLDPIPYDYIQRRGGSLARRTQLMPDPVEQPPPLGHADARRALGLPEDGRYTGCVGALDGRKGIDLLLRAFQLAALRSTDRLLLMGRLEDSIRSVFGSQIAQLHRDGRLFLFDQHVNHEQIHLGLSAMDVVCTPYPRHIGSASIVIRAAAAGRPVLSSGFGWMGYVVPRFGLGSVCDVADPDAFARALTAALDGSAGYRPGPGAERFVAFHSPANFAAAWTERIRRRLGLPPGHINRRQWDWVLEAADSTPPRLRGPQSTD